MCENYFNETSSKGVKCSMQTKTLKYKPLKRRAWDAKTLFKDIDPTSIRIDQAAKEKFKPFFWADLCAEYDAVNFYNELSTFKRQFSPEFNSFIENWYLDECNHTNGFKCIYSLLYGESEDKLLKKLNSRTPDFTELKHFFKDEFELCVLFAYDEFATVQTYKKDIFYKKFGPSQFSEWIQNVIADEAMHFGNLVRLIRYNHRNKLNKTKEVLQKIVQYEQNMNAYKATFLFDHDGPHFMLTTSELTNKCANSVLQKIIGA